jgi:DNA-binding LacI/PurR family transcriptional regulator
MARHGLDEFSSIIEGDFTERSGSAVAEQLLAERELPTAVVAANDRIAIGMLDRFRRAGMDVPGHVSITGYDDSLLAQLSHIDLTSVSQQPRAQADRAVAALITP